MMDRGKIKAVFRNEWQQTFTVGRMTGWVLLCLFPFLVTTLVQLELDQLYFQTTEAQQDLDEAKQSESQERIYRRQQEYDRSKDRLETLIEIWPMMLFVVCEHCLM